MVNGQAGFSLAVRAAIALCLGAHCLYHAKKLFGRLLSENEVAFGRTRSSHRNSPETGPASFTAYCRPANPTRKRSSSNQINRKMHEPNVGYVGRLQTLASS